MLLYVGTVILKRNERQFWRMTPRKLTALTDAHIDLNDGKDRDKKKKEQTKFIDQIF